MAAAAYHPNPSKPRIAPPRGACDTAVHVFGPGPGSAADPKAAYKPVGAPMEAVDAMHRALGIDRAVLVQATAVQVNYDALMADLRSNPRLRGVAIIDDSTTDAQLRALHEAGVRGVRFHFADFLKKRPPISTFTRSAQRVGEMGWHVAVHVQTKDLDELFDLFASLRTTLVVDHMAHVDVSLGVAHRGFQRLLELHRREHVWVRIANSDRWSVTGAPSYADAVPFGRALASNAPDRLVWATDWPHVMYKKPWAPGDAPPDDGELLDLFYDMVPDEKLRHRILVDHPARLYGFNG